MCVCVNTTAVTASLSISRRRQLTRELGLCVRISVGIHSSENVGAGLCAVYIITCWG